MELGIEVGQAIAALDGALALGQQRLQAVEVVLRAANAGQAQGLGFQHAAQLVQRRDGAD